MDFVSPTIMFIFVLGLWTNLSLASTPADSLSELVTEGVQNSYGIKSQKLKLEQSFNKRTNAYLNLLPTLSVSGGRALTATESLVSGEKVHDFTSANTLKVSGDWTIWDNYQNIRDIGTASKTLDADRISSRKEVQQYIIGLLDTFLEYQLLLSRQEITMGLLKESRWTNEESIALVKVGAKTQLDALDAEIQVVNTERDLMEINNGLLAAERNLVTLLNSEKYKTMPRIDLLKLNPYYMQDFDKHLAEVKTQWKDSFSSVNPDLNISRLQLERSAMELSQTKLGYFPTTAISVNHEINLDRFAQETPTGGTRARLDTTTIYLTFTWKFFDWFNTPRSIGNSQRDYDISLFQFQEGHRKATAEIQNLLEQFDVLQKSIEASRMVVEKSERQLNYSKEMFRIGRITLLTMQQSTNRFFDARISLASRLKAKYLVAAKILYQMGYELKPPGVDTAWIN